MARISQYKALGTKLGGYKSTLSKVQSAEYAKKHADWKAGEEKALYSQIGGSVANIIGIAKEANLARKQEDFMAREFGIGGDKFAERVTKQGLKDNPWLEQTDEQFWADENLSDKAVGLPSQVQEEVSDVKKLDYTPDPNVTKVGGEQRGATQYRKLSPSTTTTEDGTSSFPSAFTSRGVYGAESDWKAKRQGMWKVLGQEGEIEDITTARNKQIGEEALKKRMDMKGDPSLKTFDSSDRVFDNIAQDTGSIYGPPSPTDAQTKAYEQYQQYLKGLSDKSKAKQNVQSAYQGPVDAKSLALEMAGMGEAGLPKPTGTEVTDDFYGPMEEPTSDGVSLDDRVFDNVKDAEYYEANILELAKPLPHKSGKMEAAGRKYLQKMPGFEGIGGSHFDQMFDQIMGTESAGRNIRQITQKDVDAGRKKGTGRAGGLWQMERGFDKDAEGNLKGRGFQTSIQRYINMNEMFGEEVEEWVYKAQDDDTPENLTPEQQRELVFANLFMQEQSYGLSGSLDKQGNRITGINISSEDVGVDRRFDIWRRSYQKGNYGELWARKHYAGAKPGSKLYKEKIKQFERDKGRAKMRDKPWLR